MCLERKPHPFPISDMAYFCDDGTPIDPSDVPLPDLCRLCVRYQGPPNARTCGEAEQFPEDTAFVDEDTLHASMEEVQCTLTRIDYHLDDDPGRLFLCYAFISRYGGVTTIWH